MPTISTRLALRFIDYFFLLLYATDLNFCNSS